jgi:hypothetical protein
MAHAASILSERLAANAHAVCQYYLPAGRRNGRYWLVGDVQGNPGRSLFVRLAGPTTGPGRAGKWSDAATGEHGDLLDLIQLNRGLDGLNATIEEARAFLSEPAHRVQQPPRDPVPRNSGAAAQRLFAASKPVTGTLAETYLRARAITCSLALPALRYHPTCFHRARNASFSEQWPALLAAVTSPDGLITGLQRIWLARDGSTKAPLEDPRRAMGDILGNAVRFGKPVDAMAAGEGIETMLALRSLLPDMPMVAAVSSGHLHLVDLPEGLQRLYVAADNDKAGRAAADRLIMRALDDGIEPHLLLPRADDWNTDLIHDGPHATLVRITRQLTTTDAIQFFPTNSPLTNS